MDMATSSYLLEGHKSRRAFLTPLTGVSWEAEGLRLLWHLKKVRGF